MMDIKLLKKLEPLEEKFECSLMTEEDALEFIESDLKECLKIIDEEIETLKDNPEAVQYVNGMNFARLFVKEIFQGRIDEGF